MTAREALMATVLLVVLAVQVPDRVATAPVAGDGAPSGPDDHEGHPMEGLPLTVPSRIQQVQPPPPRPLPRPAPQPTPLPVGADVPVDLPLDAEGASTINKAVSVAVKTLVARSELGAVQASRVLLHVKELLGRQLQADD
ncbi:uncharacterized protein LOC126278502 [Schistocerca gregaria]|uniref:uncharacterized protein LOC126278502 n=1 Tax=Schistocerca gregaria TaxID=7010 RepID=UPI00211EA5E0|nr:uncharacterized protein LOC126278502 [Schistocerca gregaria]